MNSAPLKRGLWMTVLAIVSIGASAAPPAGYFLSLAVYRPSTHVVYAYSDLASKAFTLNGPFSVAGVPVAGDFDGNGVYDIATYQAGTWHIDTNHDLTAETTKTFGGSVGDMPLAADFDGDGIADLVIYNAGNWSIKNSKDNSTTAKTLGGKPIDIPIVADFDGDGVPDIAVYRAGTWLIQTHTAGGVDIVDHFGGRPGDVPCAVDWNHDGKADLCIYRDGIWRFKSIGANSVLDSYAFGGPGDIPLGGGVFDINGAIFVKAGASGTQDGTAAHPYATVTQAFNAAPSGGAVIRVAGGTYTENFVLWGPLHAGKNNIKLLGVSRRAINWTVASSSALLVVGSTGNIAENFTFSSSSSVAVQAIGGPGSTSPSDPGSGLSLYFNTITGSSTNNVIISGTSSADIRYNTISNSQQKAGISIGGGAGAAPNVTLAYNDIFGSGQAVAAGTNGSGVETTQSTTATIIGNRIHDNNRFGISGGTDSQLTIHGNTVQANQENGIIICGCGASCVPDTSTAVITNNLVVGNGFLVNPTFPNGFNGIEIAQQCTGTQTISGNTIDSNTGNAVEISSGTAIVTNNSMTNSRWGVTIYADSNSLANVNATVQGNTISNNSIVGVFAQFVTGSSTTMTATVGGTTTGQANTIDNNGSHGIFCNNTQMQITCPAGGNSFSGNPNGDITGCPNTCVP